ncbi:MAG: hypothetical protein A4S09_14985 [Proteobacteria bacterium SG_bin7]|nr:MAG: hypothetical protein A4S09_14985 [Proteobacteria bacterium SG_bin7]
MKTVSLFKHVNSSLNPYRWMISIVVAVLISGLFAAISLSSRLETDKKMAEALSPYLATLVESSDRPEILRVLQSIAETTHSKAILVQDGVVLASSGDLSELDRPFKKPKVKFQLWNMDFSEHEIMTSANIKNDASIHIISPLLPSLQNTFGVFVAVFIVSILISVFSSRQMRKAIKKALLPMDQLQAEIKGMLEGDSSESRPISIRELEEIRATVNSTKVALENAKDRLAEIKAKKLSTESYKRLIHDLHNPVAALRQMAKISSDVTVDNEARDEASESIHILADQVLNQVTSAKKNLEDEPISLREMNLVDCVKESISQMRSINRDKDITTNFEFSDLNIPHDPALLKRAIINLLENGVEAAKSQVRVSISKTDSNAIIRICDDGSGMDETKVPIYFQGRGKSGKANRQAFGLSSTNHIVQSHGGKMIYKRSDLGGSSFEIRLGVV